MRCFICNQSETMPGTTAVLFERGHMSLTIKAVPARICPACGETYTQESDATNLLRQAEQLARAGTKVEECEYAQVKD